MTCTVRLAAAFALALLAPIHAHAETVTVIQGDKATALEEAVPDGDDLWVNVADLKKVSGLELKPEGACIEDRCYPVDRNPGAGLVRIVGKETQFNMTRFAAHLEQPVVVDAKERVWAFGPIPETRSPLKSALAPDFAIPDRNGKLVHLSDFRGKKVLILTWASW